MGVNHPIEVRNQYCTFLLSQLDEGESPGVLELQTQEGKCVATFALSKPAFAPPIDGISQLNTISPDIGAIGGRVAKAVFKNGNHKEVFSCSVTGFDGGGEIELSTIMIPKGLEVHLPHVSYEAPL